MVKKTIDIKVRTIVDGDETHIQHIVQYADHKYLCGKPFKTRTEATVAAIKYVYRSQESSNV